MRDRSFARNIAQQHFASDKPAAWFDVLYREAAGNEECIPWADTTPSVSLSEWLDREQPDASGKKAVVIGCGLGQDAEALARAGYDVTAFDISPAAIQWCVKRWPDTSVRYVAADLFAPPPEWPGAFDLVYESNTVQALPPDVRPQTVASIASLVAPGGRVLVIARAQDEGTPRGDMPWPLTEREVRLFEKHGLRVLQLEDYLDREDPPVRRWRALLERTI